MVYSSAGYCACGEEIWIEYLHKKEGWFPRFFDVEGREIVLCPSCGHKLVEEELE